MQLFQAIILGAIQGLTEFLPVSSSGHLVIFQHLFGLKSAQLFFDISVHLGTLAAVFIVFSKDIQAMLTALGRWAAGLCRTRSPAQPAERDKDIRLVVLILAGSIPTAIIGVLIEKVADRLFSSVTVVGFMLILTGLVLWTTRRMEPASTGARLAGFSIKKALLIGLVQGVAAIPGISRSGSTISAGLWLHLDRETAARYSFLLSVPAILGAALLEAKDLPVHSQLAVKMALAGAATSCLVGYGALKLLLQIVKRGRLHFFAPYCWLVGIFAIAAAF